MKYLDALIIGAGFSGLYQLHCLRDKLKLNTLVVEEGKDIGGTWYWNCLLYTSPSPRDLSTARMPSSA